MESTPSLAETVLTKRQREAVEVAIDVGYYDIPARERLRGRHRADELRTQHGGRDLRKAESKMLRAAFEGEYPRCMLSATC